MPDEKRMIDGYEIMQSVIIDGMEIIIGENPNAKEQYIMWRRSLGESFGAESHLIPLFSNDYLKTLRDFIHCQSVYADNLGTDRIYRGSLVTDSALDSKDCVEGGMDSDLKGKVVAIRADALSPEYRARSHQLMLVTGGFGCSPGARGRVVYGTNIYSGTQERWDRTDILGVVAESNLPGWAPEKLAALRKPADKESVIDRIREDRQAVKQQPSTKKRSKGETEH